MRLRFVIHASLKKENAVPDTTLLQSDVRQLVIHQENMSVLFIPHYTPLLYSKTGVYRGIHFFLLLL